MNLNKFFRHHLLFLPLLLAVASPPHAFAQPAVQAVNLSTRMRVETGDKVGIGGFIITGTVPKTVLLRAIGPSLTHSGLVGVLANPQLTLTGCSSCVVTFNDNWRGPQEAAIQATGIPPTNDFESAILATLPVGAYTAVVTGAGAQSGLALVEVYDLDPASGKLANLSTRAFVGMDENVVIAGVLLRGGGASDTIVVRGLGPSVGVPPVLANPTLELRDSSGTLLIANNDWQDDPVQANLIIVALLAPGEPLESALIVTLPPGLYTALLAGRNNSVGIGLIEIYDHGP